MYAGMSYNHGRNLIWKMILSVVRKYLETFILLEIRFWTNKNKQQLYCIRFPSCGTQLQAQYVRTDL